MARPPDKPKPGKVKLGRAVARVTARVGKAARKPQSFGLPSRQEILDFIAASPVPVGKREIAKAFKIGSADRVALKGLLKDIERSGPVERGARRRLAPAGALPETAIIEVTGIDADGDVRLRVIGQELPAEPPELRLAPAVGDAVLGVGERALARLHRQEDGSYLASVLRKLERQGERVLGVLSLRPDGNGEVRSVDRREKTTYRVRATDTLGAQDGELVLGFPLPKARLGLPHLEVVERIGSLDDARAISLVAIYRQGIPVAFPEDAIREAEAAQPVSLDGRTDLRGYPLVTIDGADARDFDDAVWAEPDPEVKGGWHLLIAIADVSWYVRPGSALDRAAYERGNSVYFPDRVVPMLPEALSNELCSLKPEVERACMAIHMWIDADGKKTNHKVVRGLMRSAARLTYEQVQAARDGRPDETTAPLLDKVIAPLYGAFAALDRGRRKRGTLDLDLPERKVILGGDGHIDRIEPRERLDSHRLIEEFMIAANVAAAETLEGARKPCMYRVHDAPDPERLAALRDFLDSLGIQALKLDRGQVVRPQHFTHVLDQAVGRPEATLINELVLRSQAQAAYSPENIGHFGLALRRYAHFTSPIRRYADLLVHRALVAGQKLGEGGLGEVDPEAFAETGLHLSQTERRAAVAERIAIERYTVAYMSDRIGASFAARIVGVTKAGLFVSLKESGADGLIPISTLPPDYYRHDAGLHRLTGQQGGLVYSLGDSVEVRLDQADKVTGGLIFALVETGGRDRSPRRGLRARPMPEKSVPEQAGRKGRKQPGKAVPRRSNAKRRGGD